jgi:hypothetical protein
MSTIPAGLSHRWIEASPTFSTFSPLVGSDGPNPTASQTRLAICSASPNVPPHTNAYPKVPPLQSDANIENIASVKSNQKRILEDQELPCSKHKRLNQTPSPNPLHEPKSLGKTHTPKLVTPETTPIVLLSDDDTSHAGKEPFDFNLHISLNFIQFQIQSIQCSSHSDMN